MPWQWTPVLAPVGAPGVAALAVAGYALREAVRERSAGGAWTVEGAPTRWAALALLALVAGVGALVHAAGVAALLLDSKVFWARIADAAFAFVPALWLGFALLYAVPDRLTPSGLAILAVEPALAAALFWTNGAHGVMYADAIPVRAAGGLWVLDRSLGPWYYGHAAYLAGVTLVGGWLLARAGPGEGELGALGWRVVAVGGTLSLLAGVLAGAVPGALPAVPGVGPPVAALAVAALGATVVATARGDDPDRGDPDGEGDWRRADPPGEEAGGDPR